LKVHYEISMKEPATHFFQVGMRIGGLAGRESLRVLMPVWSPGSYLVRDYARNVLDLTALDGSGRTLAVNRVSKNAWLVSTGGADEIFLDYAVYAYIYTTNSSYLDTQHAVINGTSAFLLSEGLGAEPVTLTVRPHDTWKVISTGLQQLKGAINQFGAESYDVLVDSPIEVGNQHVHSFEVEGVKHEVSIFSPRPVDEGRLVSDLKRIVEATFPIFGEIPYRRYVFLVDFGETATGGLEHLNSTLCILSYLRLESSSEYRRALTLFSHEFFHTWNVKRMRPAGLGPFNYSEETYTKSLWIAEGLTSYYEDVILRRAGIFSVAEFLDDYCDNIDMMRSLPSSGRRTPEESSFEAWINHYRPNENTPNVSPSYYWQGAALGGVLDLTIRHATMGERSLDDVMRTVYRETYVKENRGYADAEFEEVCSNVSGDATSVIFKRHIHARQPIDFDSYLAYAGLTLVPKNGQVTESHEGFLGIKTAYQDGRLLVLSRLSGTPAEKSDLSGADEIIAVDGLRVDGQKLAYYIASSNPGREVHILAAREGVIMERTARLAAKPSFEYRIVKKQTASEAEKEIFKTWTLESWELPLVYVDSRPSPVKGRMLDYI